MTRFIIALLIGIGISLVRSKSQGYRQAIARRDYASFAIGVVVGAAPYTIVLWIILALVT